MGSINDYGLADFHFSDSAIRFVAESDIPAIINLFKLNYSDGYVSPEVYDGTWIKRCIYDDGIVCIVIEEDGEVVASGALILDFGDHNDQIGELARLVVHPERTGRGLGRRLIGALFEAADYSVEFALGQTRTANSFSQTMMEREQFIAIGFLPQYYTIVTRRESIVLYAKLHGNGRLLRCSDPPQVIPEVAPLATHVLSAMKLPTSLSIVEDCRAYSSESPCTMSSITRESLGQLSRVKEGRITEPMLFGTVSLDEGISFIRRRKAKYLMAVDDKQTPIGAIGYQFDNESSLLKGVELIAESHALRGQLCHAFLRASEELAAQVVEVNVSAYDACLQQTFFDLGFKPVAYAPAMVFHGTHRLDVVKMLKLNVAYDSEGTELTDRAKKVVSIIEPGFVSQLSMSEINAETGN